MLCSRILKRDHKTFRLPVECIQDMLEHKAAGASTRERNYGRQIKKVGVSHRALFVREGVGWRGQLAVGRPRCRVIGDGRFDLDAGPPYQVTAQHHPLHECWVEAFLLVAPACRECLIL